MAPLLAMKAVTDWLAPAENGGNTESQTEALKSIHEATGFVPQSTPSSESGIDQADVNGGFLNSMSSTKKANKRKIEKSFELGTQYSPREVADIKKAYDIEVPKENIKAGVISSVSKPETPSVEASANQLEQTTKTNEDLTAQKEAADRAPAPSATVINNNNTSNNSTTTTRVSPPVRPLDSTINNSMQSRYC